MIRKALISCGLAVLMVFAGAAAAGAIETRQFEGEGYSSFGFAFHYARADARQQALDAGFPDCTEISRSGTICAATMILECTR